MASIWVPEAFAVFSSNGTSAGFAVVADNSAFYPGAEVYVVSDTIAGRRGIITELSSTTGIGIRFVADGKAQVPVYGKDSMAAY